MSYQNQRPHYGVWLGMGAFALAGYYFFYKMPLKELTKPNYEWKDTQKNLADRSAKEAKLIEGATATPATSIQNLQTQNAAVGRPDLSSRRGPVPAVPNMANPPVVGVKQSLGTTA